MNGPLAYDIGMHNGDDTAYYLEKGFSVVSVEASPDLAAAGAERFAEEIGAGRVVVENIGVAKDKGKMDFYLKTSNTQTNSFVRPRGDDVEVISVQTERLSNLVIKHGAPTLMKIDIEHYDLVALDDLLEQAIVPPYICVEAHNLEVVLKVYQMGFRRFRLVNSKNAWGQLTDNYIYRIADGTRSHFHFTKHSSGPYGHDIKALPWMDIEGALALWTGRNQIFGHGWFDVHAALPADGEGMVMG